MMLVVLHEFKALVTSCVTQKGTDNQSNRVLFGISFA